MSIRQTFTDIANAIREKTGNTGLLYPSEMAQNILGIPQGGGENYLPAFIDGTANFADYASSIRNLSAIKDYAFYRNNTIGEVNFPKVKNIGEGAFAECNNLTTISFPMCTTVGKEAFAYCTKLRDAYLPVLSATSIAGAFQMCTALESVYAPNLQTIEQMDFYLCQKLSNIDFPKVSKIGYAAFQGAGILSAYFPCVYYINTAGFSNCSSLTDVSMPNLVQIADNTFKYCSSLETVTLGAYSYSNILSPTTIFSGCTNLKSIYVPSGALNYYQTSSYWSYWSDKIVPYNESDEYIYPYEYANNTTITEIPLNKQNARYLGINAFLGCTNLKSVNLPNCEVTYKGQFHNTMKSLPIEYINIGVSYLSNENFSQFSNLREFHAPNLREVSINGMFYSCSNLEVAYLPNVSMIGQGTFSYCTNLRSVNLDSVLEIPYETFAEVSPLEVINLPACKTFAIYAFRYCYGLKTVSAPNLESWGASAFTACSSLESVYIGSNVTYVGGDCVPTSGSAKIYVPNDMVDTYKNGLFSSYSSRIFGY